MCEFNNQKIFAHKREHNSRDIGRHFSREGCYRYYFSKRFFWPDLFPNTLFIIIVNMYSITLIEILALI